MPCTKPKCYTTKANTCRYPNSWIIYLRDHGGQGKSMSELKDGYKSWKDETLQGESTVAGRRDLLCNALEKDKTPPNIPVSQIQVSIQNQDSKYQEIRQRAENLLVQRKSDEKIQVENTKRRETQRNAAIYDVQKKERIARSTLAKYRKSSKKKRPEIESQMKAAEQDVIEAEYHLSKQDMFLGQHSFLKQRSDNNIKLLEELLAKSPGNTLSEKDTLYRRIDGISSLIERDHVIDLGIQETDRDIKITDSEISDMEKIVGKKVQRSPGDTNRMYMDNLIANVSWHDDYISKSPSSQIITRISKGESSIKYLILFGVHAVIMTDTVFFTYNDKSKRTKIGGISPHKYDKYDRYGEYMSRDSKGRPFFAIDDGNGGMMDYKDRRVFVSESKHTSGIGIVESIFQYPHRYQEVLQNFGKLLKDLHGIGLSHGDANLTNFMENDEDLTVLCGEYMDKMVRFKDTERTTCIAHDVVTAIRSIKREWKRLKIGTEDSWISAFKDGYGDYNNPNLDIYRDLRKDYKVILKSHLNDQVKKLEAMRAREKARMDARPEWTQGSEFSLRSHRKDLNLFKYLNFNNSL